MPTRHPRIQVTADPELSQALRDAEPHLASGLSRSKQVRELAIAGARQLAGGPRTEEERRDLIEALAASFESPETMGIDLDVMRDKRNAWPTE
ncbi:hypothetical protein BH20ACT19_BH20ACT19_03030 [soil metagenome]